MHLKRKLLARFDDDLLGLESVAAGYTLERAPRAVNLPMDRVFLVSDLFHFVDEQLRVLRTLARDHEDCVLCRHDDKILNSDRSHGDVTVTSQKTTIGVDCDDIALDHV